jgi:L-fucose mutarotase/ribose pyranase (RbsD/FucU family)
MAEALAFTRRRIERIADDALRAAGVLGVVPTPLDAVADAAGVRAVVPMPELPPAVRRTDRRLLGALWFEERALFLDETQSRVRRRFTEAHELAHALCPWHEAVLREDTEDELFRDTRAALELEANAGAGMLIFQRADFAAQAAAGPCSIRTGLALAARYGASRHAALHHYVAMHPAPLALLVAGRFPRRDGGLPVWRGVESAAFAARFGPAAARVAGGLEPGSALRELAEAARTTSEPPMATVSLGGAVFRAEAWDNRHAVLLALAPATTHRLARSAA